MEISGFTAEDVIGRLFPEVGIIPEEYIPGILDKFTRAKTGEAIAIYEIEIRTKSGRRIPIEVNMSNYLDMEGRVIGRIGVFRDISERKRADEVFKSALREKEVLLREIHHRVKNNMQVISSLINLQAARLEDPSAKEMLRESQRRIRTMALIHEKLYQSTDLNRIHFSEYVRSLCVHLFHGFQADPAKIRLKLDLEDISLDVSTSIPCGLIVNELVSNSLKHAFPDGREGEIAVHFHRTGGGELELLVSDDGVGFPRDLDFRNTGTLGMQIVTMLAEQIDGTISRDDERGTSFRISFASSA
jgi:PAS domain S-box-containing protein